MKKPAFLKLNFTDTPFGKKPAKKPALIFNWYTFEAFLVLSFGIFSFIHWTFNDSMERTIHAVMLQAMHDIVQDHVIDFINAFAVSLSSIEL
jgi:hypothetical protein